MSVEKIKINGKTYPIKFGYGAFRFMGKKWKCKGIQETLEKLSILDKIEDGLTFEQEDIIADFLLGGIACAGGRDVVLPKQDDAIEFVIKNPEVLMDVMTLMMDSLPTASEDKKKVPKPIKKKKA